MGKGGKADVPTLDCLYLRDHDIYHGYHNVLPPPMTCQVVDNQIVHGGSLSLKRMASNMDPSPNIIPNRDKRRTGRRPILIFNLVLNKWMIEKTCGMAYLSASSPYGRARSNPGVPSENNSLVCLESLFVAAGVRLTWDSFEGRLHAHESGKILLNIITLAKGFVDVALW